MLRMLIISLYKGYIGVRIPLFMRPLYIECMRYILLVKASIIGEYVLCSKIQKMVSISLLDYDNPKFVIFILNCRKILSSS